MTSKRGADGTLQSQFMLFCVITSHYGRDWSHQSHQSRETGPDVSLLFAWVASVDILYEKYIPLFAWPALSVVPGTISDYLKALSRASVPCPED